MNSIEETIAAAGEYLTEQDVEAAIEMLKKNSQDNNLSRLLYDSKKACEKERYQLECFIKNERLCVLEMSYPRLLSESEYNEYWYSIPPCSKNWYLSTPNKYLKDYINIVIYNGTITIGSLCEMYAYRPVVQIYNARECGLNQFDRVMIKGTPFIMFSADMAIAESYIGMGPFSYTGNNDYETSLAKRAISRWFLGKR